MTDPDLSRDTADADASHLRVLSICYYVMAALSFCLCGGYGIFMAFLGGSLPSAIRSAPPPPNGQPFPQEAATLFERMFTMFGVAYAVVGVAACILQILAGIGIAQRKWLPFCYVAGGVTCMQMPHGTVLGIFTFIVLARRSVQDAFAATARAAAAEVRGDRE